MHCPLSAGAGGGGGEGGVEPPTKFLKMVDLTGTPFLEGVIFFSGGRNFSTKNKLKSRFKEGLGKKEGVVFLRRGRYPNAHYERITFWPEVPCYNNVKRSILKIQGYCTV